MALTELAVRKIKPKTKQFKQADGRGLYLLIHPNGSKYWRLKYRFNGKEKLLALGVYPAVTLAEARRKREDAQRTLSESADPMAEKRSGRSCDPTFEAIAREWHVQFRSKWTADHGDTILRRLEANVFPYLGSCPLSEIKPMQLLTILRKIETRGACETAHRVKQICAQVFQYSIATGIAEHNPAAELGGALRPVNSRHFPSVQGPRQVGELMRAIDGYAGTLVTRCALRLAPHVFVRPGELRHAEWSEVDLPEKLWRIPSAKMKMRSPHLVPLSQQSLSILSDLHPVTGRGKYLFPGARSESRPMSENTINAALRRLGYPNQEMTGHGFRSIASTMINEKGWNRDAIERQLAHCERDLVRAAYNYAEYLDERKQMMQHWSDYLEQLCKDSLELTRLCF